MESSLLGKHPRAAINQNSHRFSRVELNDEAQLIALWLSAVHTDSPLRG